MGHNPNGHPQASFNFSPGFGPNRQFANRGDTRSVKQSQDTRNIQVNQSGVIDERRVIDQSATTSGANQYPPSQLDSLKRDMSKSPPLPHQIKRFRSDDSLGLSSMAIKDDSPQPSEPTSINRNTNVRKMQLDNTEIKILVALKDNEEIDANDLAISLGFASKKEINPSLYLLQRKKLVTKTQDMPPVWVINGAGHEQLHRHNLYGTQSTEAAAAAATGEDTAAHVKREEDIKPVPFSSGLSQLPGIGRGRGILNIAALQNIKPGDSRQVEKRETETEIKTESSNSPPGFADDADELELETIDDKDDTATDQGADITETPQEKAERSVEIKDSSQQEYPPVNIKPERCVEIDQEDIEEFSDDMYISAQRRPRGPSSYTPTSRMGCKPPPPPGEMIKSRDPNYKPPEMVERSQSLGNLTPSPVPLMDLNPEPQPLAARGKAQFMRTSMAYQSLSQPINNQPPNLSQSTPYLNTSAESNTRLPPAPHQVLVSRSGGGMAPSQSDPEITARNKLFNAIEKPKPSNPAKAWPDVGNGASQSSGTNDPSTESKNPISALYEWAAVNKRKITFELLDSNGPSHKPKYVIKVYQFIYFFLHLLFTYTFIH